MGGCVGVWVGGWVGVGVWVWGCGCVGVWVCVYNKHLPLMKRTCFSSCGYLLHPSLDLH